MFDDTEDYINRQIDQPR